MAESGPNMLQAQAQAWLKSAVSPAEAKYDLVRSGMAIVTLLLNQNSELKQQRDAAEQVAHGFVANSWEQQDTERSLRIRVAELRNEIQQMQLLQTDLVHGLREARAAMAELQDSRDLLRDRLARQMTFSDDLAQGLHDERARFRRAREVKAAGPPVEQQEQQKKASTEIKALRIESAEKDETIADLMDGLREQQKKYSAQTNRLRLQKQELIHAREMAAVLSDSLQQSQSRHVARHQGAKGKQLSKQEQMQQLKAAGRLAAVVHEAELVDLTG